MNNKIKSLICLLLALCLAFSLIGCSPAGGNTDTSSDNSTADNSSDDLDDLTDDDDLDDDSLEDDWSDDEEDWEEDDWSDEEDWDEDEEDDESSMQEIGIYNTTPVNTNFKGINGIYSLWNGFSDKLGRVYTEEETQTEFDRLEKMGLKMIRSFYSSGLAWDTKTQSFDFSKPDMQTFFKNCREMEKRGIEVGITPHWDFKGLMDHDGNTVTMNTEPTNGSLTNAYGIYVKNDPDQTFKNLGEFMRQSVLAFKANGVNNIKYFFCFTEINNVYYYIDNALYGNDAEWSRKTMYEKRRYDDLLPLYDKAITELDKSLKESGLREHYKIVGPCDSYRYDDQYNDIDYSEMVRYTLKNLSDKVDIIGSHRGYDRAKDFTEANYKYIPEEQFATTISEVKTAGKEFWIDEYNVFIEEQSTREQLRATLSHPWKGSALGAMTTAVMGMGASNVFLWSISDQQYPNVQTDGSEFYNGVQVIGYLPSLFESYTPYLPWYACSLITKYIGQGTTYLCDEGTDVYAGYIERDDGHITLIVVNYNYEDVNVEYSFEKSLSGKTLYRHLYDPYNITPEDDAKLIGVSAKATGVTTQFYDTLPAGAVAIYTTMKD